MSTAWVLSEESPFTSDEESGGCVCGVFASPSAALLSLGGWIIGPEGLAEIVWTSWHEGSLYEGRGHGTRLYILRCHPVEEEATIRQDLAALASGLCGGPEPLLALTTEALLALLTAPSGQPAPWEEPC